MKKLKPSKYEGAFGKGFEKIIKKPRFKELYNAMLGKEAAQMPRKWFRGAHLAITSPRVANSKRGFRGLIKKRLK